MSDVLRFSFYVIFLSMTMYLNLIYMFQYEPYRFLLHVTSILVHTSLAYAYFYPQTIHTLPNIFIRRHKCGFRIFLFVGTNVTSGYFYPQAQTSGYFYPQTTYSVPDINIRRHFTEFNIVCRTTSNVLNIHKPKLCYYKCYDYKYRLMDISWV